MKKKFKLIKKYPGNSNVGAVYTQVGSDTHGTPTINCLGKIISPEFYPEYFEEVNELLFRTEDDVDIYPGDTFYTTSEQTYCEPKECLATVGSHNNSGYKRFSTLVAAQVWAEENRPQFSVKDMEIIAGNVIFNGFHDKEHFVAKLKIEAAFHKKKKKK